MLLLLPSWLSWRVQRRSGGGRGRGVLLGRLAASFLFLLVKVCVYIYICRVYGVYMLFVCCLYVICMYDVCTAGLTR